MLKLWIYLPFLCMGIAASEENNFFDASDEFYEDYSTNLGDNSFEKLPNLSSEEIENTPKTSNWLVEDLGKGSKSLTTTEKNLEGVIDYQIEDNRSGENDNINKDEPQSFIDSKGVLDISDMNQEYLKTLSEEIEKEMNDEFSEAKSNENKSNSAEMINQILEDTKQILANDIDNDFAEDSVIKDKANKNITTDYKTILDETKMLLEESEDDSDEQIGIENVSKKSIVNNDGSELIADLIELNDIKKQLNSFEDEGNLLQYDNDHIGSSQESDESEYEKIEDANLDQIFAKSKENVNVHDVEPLPDDALFLEKIIEDEPILYQNDDLLPNDIETTPPVTENIPAETNPLELVINEETNEMIDYQLDMMINFTNNNIKDILSAARSSNNPKRVWLNVEEPTVITSPDPYPTNSITDWLFEGTGTGIEFNITDCDINGHVGDYLLIKPGGIDESGSNGIIFTYHLNTERRYRFLDVDRMFMRFQTNMGLPMRGFKISARMLVQAPTIWEPEPDPESSIQYPEHTLTLNLGGISLEGFIEIEEQFQQIVADMATMYINANNISTGDNITSILDATQITSKALCFHNWPKYEMCAEVQFGVRLVSEEGQRPRLDEEDLRTMWFQYYDQDPFAVRLRMLGITEFQVPNDHGVLLVWLVIAAGVVISMAMLAFALWRYSCFEDYSRMPMYSDTDSLADKRRFDMFPTPHQTLPPLYTDADYKWVDNDEPCKVDVSGYSNRNFLADDMFDIDSEDEVVPGRNRYTTDV